MSFAENLKKVLNQKGMDQITLAKKSGLTAYSVSTYTTGKCLPFFQTGADIADTLDVSLDWLMDRDYRNTQAREYVYLSEQLKELMEICDVGLTQLVHESGVNWKVIRRIQRGGNIQMASAVMLADYFDTSLDYLAGLGPMKGLGE